MKPNSSFPVGAFTWFCTMMEKDVLHVCTNVQQVAVLNNLRFKCVKQNSLFL